MSPNTSFNTSGIPRVTGSNLQPIRKEIAEQRRQQNVQKIVLWGTINLILLAIILNDISNGYDACSQYHIYFHYFEHILIVIFFFNCIYYLYKYYKCSKTTTAATAKKDKKNTSLAANIHNINNITLKSLNSSFNDSKNTMLNCYAKTSMDTSAASWMNNSSLNTSNLNKSSSWGYQTDTTPKMSNSPVYKSSPILPANLSSMALVDEETLSQYLKGYEAIESTQNSTLPEQTTNSLSFFWNHPVAKMKDSSPMLRRCQYQLSTPSPTHHSPKSDDKNSSLNQSQCSDTWKRLNVDSVALMQWTENLRIWISHTILSRLICEFETIDKSLHAQGLTDVTIGQVGLDRLRKTAQGQVLQNTPNLPTIVTFLELHNNQEYLVGRIRELARGGCMSEYKWNGGGHHNDKDWDSTLPTDAAIVMHLTSVYLDTQLVPAPNNPDVRPFSGCHFIRSTEKLPEPQSAHTLIIHEVTVRPPHYRVLIGAECYEMVKGYNNLFHSILLFLYQVNERELGMLGRVSLGRAGLNMLWIINGD